METAECISCGAELTFRTRPKMGTLVTCTECSAELEVVWLDPVELDWPFDESNDDEDEEELYFDDEDDEEDFDD